MTAWKAYTKNTGLGNFNPTTHAPMSEQTKVKVGDALYRIGWKDTIMPVKVVKVGSKYFYLEHIRARYDIDTLFHRDENYSQNNEQLYRSEQEILDLREMADLYKKIKEVFNHYSRPTLSLEQLRAIDAIIKTTI